MRYRVTYWVLARSPSENRRRSTSSGVATHRWPHCKPSSLKFSGMWSNRCHSLYSRWWPSRTSVNEKNPTFTLFTARTVTDAVRSGMVGTEGRVNHPSTAAVREVLRHSPRLPAERHLRAAEVVGPVGIRELDRPGPLQADGEGFGAENRGALGARLDHPELVTGVSRLGIELIRRLHPVGLVDGVARRRPRRRLHPRRALLGVAAGGDGEGVGDVARIR